MQAVGEPLPTRSLGALSVPAVGYGAMVLSSHIYDAVDDWAVDTALDAAVDAGSTFMDTSDAYPGNEELLARLLRRHRRDDIQIATKFGCRVPRDEPQHLVPVPWTNGPFVVNAEPRLVRRYLETSLRRLATDHVDLWFPHFPDPEVPIEDTVGAMAELATAGMVRHLGLSNATVEQLHRAQAVHPIAAVQVEWSMWHPIDPALLAQCESTGVGVVAWSPLGRGFLAGALTAVGEGDFRQHVDRLVGDNLRTNNERFAPVRAVAAELGLTTSELALVWLLHQSDRVVPIPGSRTPAHIATNAAAARRTLHPDELARVDAALAAFDPVGHVT